MGDLHLLFFASFLAHSGPGHGQTAKGVRSDGCFLHNRLPSVPLQKREKLLYLQSLVAVGACGGPVNLTAALCAFGGLASEF